MPKPEGLGGFNPEESYKDKKDKIDTSKIDKSKIKVIKKKDENSAEPIKMEIIEDPIPKDTPKDFEADLKAQIAWQFGEEKARRMREDAEKFAGTYKDTKETEE
jgi:hypothetical protein